MMGVRICLTTPYFDSLRSLISDLFRFLDAVNVHKFCSDTAHPAQEKEKDDDQK